MSNFLLKEFYGNIFEFQCNRVELKFYGILYSDIEELAERIDWDRDTDEIVRQLQLLVDGDFLCFMVSQYETIVFTDLLGRYTCFYTIKNARIDLSTNLYELAKNYDTTVNQMAALDTLCYGFSLTGDTIFNEVKALKANSYVKIGHNSVDIQCVGTMFWWVDHVRTDYLSVKSSIELRLDYIKKENRGDVFLDLTGGMDSRLTMLLLKDNDLLHVCQKYVQDEYVTVRELYDHYSLNGLVTTTEYDFTINEETLNFIKWSQGSVNLHTAVVCSSEEKAYKVLLGDRKYRVMGLGGEFLRKAKTLTFGTPLFLLRNIMPEIHLEKFVLAKGLRTRYIQHLRTLCDSSDSRFPFIKQYYVRYYFYLVTRIGETRARRSHLIVQPLYTKEIIASYLTNSLRTNINFFFRLNSECSSDWNNIPFFGMNSKIAKGKSKFRIYVLKKEIFLNFKRALIALKSILLFQSGQDVSKRFARNVGVLMVKDKYLLSGIFSRLHSMDIFLNLIGKK
jgi:hypothetical protein